MDVKGFYIGYVSKTRGLKGELQLYFQYEDYDMLDINHLFIKIAHRLVPFFVREVKMLKNKTGYFFLEDVTSIAQAQELVGKEVYIDESLLPQKDPYEFSLGDLVGFQVFDKTYGNIGEILEVRTFPQQNIAVVQHQHRELLFPLNDDFIVAIDEDSEVLSVDLPDGLVAIYGGIDEVN